MLNSPKEPCATECCGASTEAPRRISQEEELTKEIAYLASRIEEYNRILQFRVEHPHISKMLDERKLGLITRSW